jgi:DNA-directed RNA polymerase subunit K/omega
MSITETDVREAKRAKQNEEYLFPILIDGMPLKPASRADIEVPDELEANEDPKPQPAHVGEDGVHYGWLY